MNIELTQLKCFVELCGYTLFALFMHMVATKLHTQVTFSSSHMPWGHKAVATRKRAKHLTIIEKSCYPNQEYPIDMFASFQVTPKLILQPGET